MFSVIESDGSDGLSISAMTGDLSTVLAVEGIAHVHLTGRADKDRRPAAQFTERSFEGGLVEAAGAISAGRPNG